MDQLLVVVFSSPPTQYGDDDFGQGHGLSGVVDTKLTEAGNVPGSGTTNSLTTHRILNESGVSNQRFEFPANMQNVLQDAEEWLVMFKFSNYMTQGQGMLLDWNSGTTAGWDGSFGMRRSESGATMEVWGPGGAASSHGIKTVLNTSDENVYWCIYRKSGQNTRAFQSVGSKPTVWANIDEDDKKEFDSGEKFDIEASDVATIGQRTSNEYITVSIHWMIISTDPSLFISD